MRRKYLQRFWLLAALSFLIVPAIGFIVYVMQWDPAVFIFGTVLMIVIAQSPINSYRQYIKNGIMKDFTGFFKDFDYRFGNLVDAEKSGFRGCSEIMTDVTGTIILKENTKMLQ